jgi:hypothetical protein
MKKHALDDRGSGVQRSIQKTLYPSIQSSIQTSKEQAGQRLLTAFGRPVAFPGKKGTVL